MLEVGSRSRNQPPPPHVLFEALTQPHRGGGVRPWLMLLDDEQEPEIVEAEEPHLTVGHFRKRMNELINGSLRSTFGG